MIVRYKNFLSEYELKYVVWVGIEYDKEKLISFFDRYQLLKSIPKTHESQEELEIMESILKSHNPDSLLKLQQNDFEYCRWATIEKLSRLSAVQILLDGRYSKDTFSTASNLPINDFKLMMKRTKELINTINNTIIESDVDTSNIPGIK